MLCLGIHLLQNVVKFHDEYIKCKNYDFSKLPPHIIVQILAQLRLHDFKNAVLVCQSWYYASWASTITNKLWVMVPYEATESDFLARPINNLLIQMANIKTFKYRKLLRKYNYSIRQFEVHCNCLPVTTVFELFIYLSNVETFKMFSSSKDFSPSNFDGCKLIQKHRESISHNMGKIKSLSIQTCYKNLKAYQTLIGYCRNIEILHWNEDHLPMHEHSEFVFDYLLNPDANRSLNNINDLLIHSIDRKRSSKFFERMVQLELRNIKKLSLTEISLTYYDIMFKEFCKSYNELESLFINGCNTQQLHDICKYLRRLKTFQVIGTDATNLIELGNLNLLQCLTVERVGIIRNDDSLVRLFDLRFPYLQKLAFNHVGAVMLQMICKNFINLIDLRLESCDTKDCEPIYRYLIKLKKLYISFTDPPTLHSSHFWISDEWNITNLAELEDLYVSCCVPGLTPELIQKLPQLNPKCLENIYDPTDEELRDLAEEDDEEIEQEVVEQDIEFASIFNTTCCN